MGKENAHSTKKKALPPMEAGVRKPSQKAKQGSPKAAKESGAATSGVSGRVAAKYVISSTMGYPASSFHGSSDEERRVWGCYDSLEAAKADAWHILYTQNDMCMEEEEVKRKVKVTQQDGGIQMALQPDDSEWFTVYIEPVRGL